ncbi:hypothetical protein HDU76_013112 [Blyttiomyces sp. JEL0837]|nr:hypothetical protein HDU76_013112 [Blyttiomyces sp. JEL0837]
MLTKDENPAFQVDWFFDFISPFAYLQFELLQRQPLTTSSGKHIKIIYKPTLFAGLLENWGQLGPAEIPPKRTFTYEISSWIAHKHGIPFTQPAHHPFHPLPLLRLAVCCNGDPIAIRRIFRFVWGEGHVASQEEYWKPLLHELGVSEEDIGKDDVKEMLRRNGREAVEMGVFGVPSLVVRGMDGGFKRLFWGVDSTEMARYYLKGDPFFKSDVFVGAEEVSPEVHRKKYMKKVESGESKL